MKKSKNEAVLIARHINTFLNNYMPGQKTRSEHTLKSYDTAMSLYLGFLEAEKDVDSSNLCAESFNSTTIEEWMIWLMEKRGCSPETCNIRLASLRAFLSHLGKNETSMLYLSSSASQIDRKKTFQKKVRGMSKEAVKAFLAAPDVSTKTGRRDLALFVLMYGAALRIDEVLSLKVKQLQLNAKKPYVTIIGKRDKIRTLYLLPKSVAHIKKHLQEFHGASPNPEAYLFYSRNDGGNPVSRHS